MTTIVVKPSISNTDTITSLQLTTPASFSMVENPILYGGSSGLTLSSSNISKFCHFIDQDWNQIDVELYVLNSCFIIWFESFGKGVEIGYRSLILHALTKDEGEECIYLQIEQNEISNDLENTFELTIKSNHKEETIQLFKELNLQDVIKDTYKALTTCTSFHADPASDVEEDQEQIPTFPIREQISLTETDPNNVADDLNNEYYNDENDEINGGMIVDVGAGPVIGVVRVRDDDDQDESSKNRKLK